MDMTVEDYCMMFPDTHGCGKFLRKRKISHVNAAELKMVPPFPCKEKVNDASTAVTNIHDDINQFIVMFWVFAI